MIVNRCLSNIFKQEKLIAVKNSGAHLILENSANQNLGSMLVKSSLHSDRDICVLQN